MVFFTSQLLVRSRGPDEFWRKRKIFRLSARFPGRFRNCYSMAIRAVHKSLLLATKFRDPKREFIKQTWVTRINSAVNEHGMTFKSFKEGLKRYDIVLNNKSMADLAVWEPRTFKSLANLTSLAERENIGLKN